MDKDDIAALWDAITPKLYGYLLNTLRDKSLAEDMLQSAWLKAIEKLSSFHGTEAEFSSWLFAIARNECKQHWRKSGREIPFNSELHDKEFVDAKDEDRIFLDQVVERLAPPDRELLRLRFIGGLPLNEIAKILKINQIAVRVRMHRAIASAKIVLQKQSYEKS